MTSEKYRATAQLSFWAQYRATAQLSFWAQHRATAQLSFILEKRAPAFTSNDPDKSKFDKLNCFS